MSGGDGTRAAARFFGLLMMAAGGLIALTTGACTLYVVLAGLMANGSGGYGTTGEWVVMALVIGGLPCLIGVGLFLGGRKLSRPPRARRVAPVESDDEPTLRS
ncbi:hypothetical protein [Brevundimonas sp.]|uniref:hypothetical protein n=1 Tax=Brevundimonas sp. TaxID=1871086 RepID=UPI002D3CA709|nr:hypothetical protein [Brevundimonas sp.]HYD28965.1 hypothetical protein [Brevundimonas sp.]